MPSPYAHLIGTPAPDFLLDEDQATALSSFRSLADVVLFFYPKDQTPGCTAQACSFRDDYASFRRLGAEVIGISSDPADSHRLFADRFQLPYRLVVDADSSIRRRYQIQKTWGLIPGRVSLLIDRGGTIRAVHDSQFRPRSHVPVMLAALTQLQAERG